MSTISEALKLLKEDINDLEFKEIDWNTPDEWYAILNKDMIDKDGNDSWAYIYVDFTPVIDTLEWDSGEDYDGSRYSYVEDLDLSKAVVVLADDDQREYTDEEFAKAIDVSVETVVAAKKRALELSSDKWVDHVNEHPDSYMDEVEPTYYGPDDY